MEEWRQSLSCPDYEVSSEGRVRRKEHFGTLPNGGTRKYGGKAWTGCWDNSEQRFIFRYGGKTYRVHVLVCEAFHGPKPFDGAVACHKDEDGRNSRANNLCWGTQKENLNYPRFRRYAAATCRSKFNRVPLDDTPF